MKDAPARFTSEELTTLKEKLGDDWTQIAIVDKNIPTIYYASMRNVKEYAVASLINIRERDGEYCASVSYIVDDDRYGGGLCTTSGSYYKTKDDAMWGILHYLYKESR